MRQSGLLLEKYWVTHGGYFRLANVLAFGYGDNRWEAPILSWHLRGKRGQENFNERVQKYDGL